MTEKKIFSPKEAAQKLNISPSILNRMIKSGVLIPLYPANPALVRQNWQIPETEIERGLQGFPDPDVWYRSKGLSVPAGRTRITGRIRDDRARAAS